MTTSAPIRSELTWEEYAEMYRDSWPKLSRYVLAIAFGIAVVLFFFGAFLTYLIPAKESLIGPVFVCLGPFVAIMALWDQIVRVKRSRRSLEDEARTNFQQLYSGIQEFSFDNDKLHLNRNGVERQIPWIGLTYVAERKRTIVLSTGDQVAVLARQSVGEQTLTLFRDVILGHLAASAQVRVSARDYFLASFTQLWRKNLWLLAFGNIAGIAAIVGLIVHLGVPSQPVDFFWGKLLCILFLVAVLTMQFWVFPFLFFTKQAAKWPADYSFGENGFWVTGADKSGFLAWREVRYFEETDRFLRLYRKDSSYYLLPKKCLGSEQTSIVTRLLESSGVRQK